MRVLLTLPAYNEEQSLPQLLQGFHQEMSAAGFPHTVVVVEDGSTDGTRAVLEQWSARLPLELIVHPSNRGLGETIRDGLRRAAAMAQPEDVIVTMDADNTHPPALIPEMVRRLQAGYDLVIASRYRSGARVTGLHPWRHLMSFGARLLFTLLFPLRGVRDYTCGFRAYRPAVLQQAFAAWGDALVTERGFACMAEILLKISRRKVRMCELLLVLRYEQKGGASKMKVAGTVAHTLRLMIRLRLRHDP